MSDLPPMPPLIVPPGQVSAPYSAQKVTGEHGRGVASNCEACRAMREAPRYPGAWPGDDEPFGHEAPPEREYLR